MNSRSDPASSAQRALAEVAQFSLMAAQIGWAGKIFVCPGCGAINAVGLLGCLTCQVALVFEGPQTGLFSRLSQK
eukprot:11211318-Lingulodinium_polyedra.AAC.1